MTKGSININGKIVALLIIAVLVVLNIICFMPKDEEASSAYDTYYVLNNYKKTDAEIIKIKERTETRHNRSRNGKSRSSYQVTVHDAVLKYYGASGKEYTTEFRDVGSNHPVGSIMEAYYDPADETVCISKREYESVGNVSVLRKLIANGWLVFLDFAGIVVVITLFRKESKVQSRTKADIKIENRYKSYEEYGGNTTERAGTLFDREVNPEDTKL